jgi:hypothetical protein
MALALVLAAGRVSSASIVQKDGPVFGRMNA